MRRKQLTSVKKKPTAKRINFYILLILVALVTLGILSVLSFSTATRRVASFLSFSTVQANIDREKEYQEEVPLLTQEQDGVVLHGLRTKPEIALTFDAEMTDGMKENYLSGRVKSSFDQRIVDTLVATQTKATFFLTGMWMELFPNAAKELAKNPLFELGSHSYADTSFDGNCFGLPQLPNSESAKVKDIETTQNLLYQVTGKQNLYFRFPGGCYGKNDLQMVTKKEHLLVVHWDVAGDDGFNDDTNQIVHNVEGRVQNGSIIILHLNGTPTAPKTAEALPTIITDLKDKGFTFVTVSELLQPE